MAHAALGRRLERSAAEAATNGDLVWAELRQDRTAGEATRRRGARGCGVAATGGRPESQTGAILARFDCRPKFFEGAVAAAGCEDEPRGGIGRRPSEPLREDASWARRISNALPKEVAVFTASMTLWLGRQGLSFFTAGDEEVKGETTDTLRNGVLVLGITRNLRIGWLFRGDGEEESESSSEESIKFRGLHGLGAIPRNSREWK